MGITFGIAGGIKILGGVFSEVTGESVGLVESDFHF